MARVFLTALAVIAAVLGYIMDIDLLLYIAGAFFLFALLTLAALAVKRRRRRAAAERQHDAMAVSREDELRSLGISDIRPKTSASAERVAGDVDEATFAQVPDDRERDEEPSPLDAEEEVSGGAAATPEDGPLPEHHPEPRTRQSVAPAEAESAAEPEVEPLPMFEAREESPFWRVHSPTAITSTLRALWAATDVQTVALFSTDPSGDAYTLEVALSHNPSVRREGRFPAGDHLLDSVSPERPLTMLEANDPLVRMLPYYKRSVHVGAAAVLPVRNYDGAPAFLVVDLHQDQTGFTERQRDLLVRYADLLSAMLLRPAEEESNQKAAPTRRSIIAEEMAHARKEDRPLALALVYRADADAITGRGPDAVAAAERDLRLHLEDLAPRSRVERFSELVYGVFLYDESDAIEAWAKRVRTRGAEVDLPLVTGVARLASHSDPDELRADAFNALQLALAEQEAYVIE